MRRSTSSDWRTTEARARRRGQSVSRPSRVWFVVFSVLTGALAASIVAAAYTSPLFSVHHVQVRLARLPDEWEERAVKTRATVPAGTPLVGVARKALAGKVRTLPWVRSVDVRRCLPDTVLLLVDVRRPVAAVAVGGRRWEVDEEGVAIRPARAAAHLPEISLEGSARVQPGRAVPAKGLQTALAASMLARTTKPLQGARIAVDQNAGICFNNPDAVSVSLGQADDLLYKLALIRRIYEHRPDIAADIQEVDLRCPEAPACTTRKPDGTPSRSSSSG